MKTLERIVQSVRNKVLPLALVGGLSFAGGGCSSIEKAYYKKDFDSQSRRYVEKIKELGVPFDKYYNKKVFAELCKSGVSPKKVHEVYQLLKLTAPENADNELMLSMLALSAANKDISTHRAIIEEFVKRGEKINPFSTKEFLELDLGILDAEIIKKITSTVYEFRNLTNFNPSFSRLSRAKFADREGYQILRSTDYELVFLKGNFKDVNFLNYVFEDKERIKLLQDRSGLVQRITERLEGLNHTDREYASYDQDWKKALDNLDVVKLLMIDIALRNLGDPSFAEEIMKKVNQDVNDTFSEYGGIIKTSDNGFYLKFFDSRGVTERNTRNDESYGLPKKAWDEPFAGTFHFHATCEDDSKYAGPSDIGFFSGDILCAIPNKGYYDFGLVITKLAGNSYNVDAYFAAGKNGEPVVVDLGNYYFEGKQEPAKEEKTDLEQELNAEPIEIEGQVRHEKQQRFPWQYPLGGLIGLTALAGAYVLGRKHGSKSR